MLHTYRYKPTDIIKIIRLVPDDDVIQTCIDLKDVLSLVASVETIIELILVSLEKLRNTKDEKKLKKLSDELIKLFSSQFKTIFKFQDLKALLIHLNSNDGKDQYSGKEMNLLKQCRIIYANALIHVNTNSDELAEILELLYESERSRYFKSQNNHWSEIHNMACRYAFLAGSVRKEASSYAFFKANNKKDICNIIFKNAGIA